MKRNSLNQLKNYLQTFAAGMAQLVQWLGYQLDNLGFKSPQKEEILLFSKAYRLALGLIQSTIQWGSFQEVKWPQCKADHLPLPSVKVKNEWCYTVTSPVRLHSMHRTWQHPCYRKGCLDIQKFQLGVKLPCDSQAEILLRFCQHRRQCSFVHLNLDKDIPLRWRICHSLVQVFY
jgi:hypothetical protein